jgi:hypothetical protein
VTTPSHAERAESVGPTPPGYDRRDMAQAIERPDRAAGRGRRPDWFHRGHPVFFPLAGFFTGMVAIIVVPGLYAAILKWVAGYERAEDLFPFVLLFLALPIGLLVPPRTRRFGRYMVLGMLTTLVVVVGVAAFVLWILLQRDA